MAGALKIWNAATNSWDYVSGAQGPKGDKGEQGETGPAGSGVGDGEVVFTPKEAAISGVEGTMFYCSTDNSVYVATE